MLGSSINGNDILRGPKLPRIEIDNNLVLETLLEPVEENRELIEKPTEKVIDQLLSHLNRQLIQEVIFLDDNMIELPIGGQGVCDLVDHLVLEFSMRVSSIYLHEPLIELGELVLEVFVNIVVQLLDEVIDITHHIGEQEDTHELDQHGEEVLVDLNWVEVSVAKGGEGCEHPVDGGDVSGRLVVAQFAFFEEELMNPSFIIREVVVADVEPDTADTLGS